MPGGVRIPETSVTLISEISGNPGSVRWSEMFDRYKEPMVAFLASRYPTLEADDIVQETMIALSSRLGKWRYSPDEKGHFRNYLMGILKHKAEDAMAKRVRESKARERLKSMPDASGGEKERELRELRANALEVALDQLMADESVNALHKTVFRCVAIQKEPPETVAARLAISRANVDQIKKRMIVRLRSLMETLLKA